MSRPSTAEAEASSPSPSSRSRTSTALPRAMSPTRSTSARVPVAIVSSAHRDLVGGGDWYRQTPSCAGRLDTFGQIGSPGQDLRRLASGPALYLNGPPDKGPRATIATTTALRRYGAFGKDAGPGAVMTLLEKRSACTRSAIGPDPYDTMVRARRIEALTRARSRHALLTSPVPPLTPRDARAARSWPAVTTSGTTRSAQSRSAPTTGRRVAASGPMLYTWGR
jgi:hypothetical protein